MEIFRKLPEITKGETQARIEDHLGQLVEDGKIEVRVVRRETANDCFFIAPIGSHTDEEKRAVINKAITVDGLLPNLFIPYREEDKLSPFTRAAASSYLDMASSTLSRVSIDAYLSSEHLDLIEERFSLFLAHEEHELIRRASIDDQLLQMWE